jgi:peptide deformylase
MAQLSVIVAPDPRLKVRSSPVGTVDSQVRRLMDDLLETMYAAPGIGLSAVQVGVPRRVLVVDVARDDEEPKSVRLADPVILWRSEDVAVYEEGCLSLPEHYAEVERSARLRVRFLDHDNRPVELEAEGLLATCLQHEIDHLEGVLFVDRISALRRNIILRKLAKAKKARVKASA